MTLLKTLGTYLLVTLLNVLSCALVAWPVKLIFNWAFDGLLNYKQAFGITLLFYVFSHVMLGNRKNDQVQ